MATTFRNIASFISAVLAIGSLGSCGDKGHGSNVIENLPQSLLLADDFKGVCSGAPVSNATAYDPAAKTHKIVYFTPYKDDLTDSSSSLPRAWTVAYSSDAYRAVDLVLCSRRTATSQVKVCDGYKDNDRPTQNKVRWHTATYQLSLHEARTGKTLVEKTIQASDTECPMFMNFDNDTEIVDDYATLSDSAVADFLRPHVVH